MPLAGDRFSLIEAGSLSSAGVGVTVAGLGSGLGFTPAFNPDGLVVTFTSAVPEPGSWALFGAGLALIAGRRMRRRSRA